MIIGRERIIPVAVEPREEIAGRLRKVVAERQVRNRQLDVAVVAHVDPDAGTRIFQLDRRSVDAGHQIDVLRAALRNQHIARTQIREESSFDLGNAQPEIVKIRTARIEVFDAGVRIEILDQRLDLCRNPRVAEGIRLGIVGHGKQDVIAPREFLDIAVLGGVVIERHAHDAALAERRIDNPGIVDKSVGFIHVVGLLRIGRIVGIEDVAVGHEPVVVVIDQEQGYVVDQVHIGLGRTGPGRGDKRRKVRRQHKRGRFAHPGLLRMVTCSGLGLAAPAGKRQQQGNNQ